MTGKRKSMASSSSSCVPASKRYRARVVAASSARTKHVDNLKMFCSYGTITSSTSTQVEANFSFKASDFPNFSNMAPAFDQYKIKRVTLHFIPQQNNSIVESSGESNTGVYTTALDYDNVTNFGSGQLNTLLAYDTCVFHEPMKRARRVVVPRVAIAAYGASAFTSFANQGNQWIDCASNAVVHYGIRSYFSQCVTSTITYLVMAEAIFDFRSGI